MCYIEDIVLIQTCQKFVRYAFCMLYYTKKNFLPQDYQQCVSTLLLYSKTVCICLRVVQLYMTSWFTFRPAKARILLCSSLKGNWPIYSAYDVLYKITSDILWIDLVKIKRHIV